MAWSLRLAGWGGSALEGEVGVAVGHHDGAPPLDECPRQRLAAIIALDQFSRSIHRNSAKAFASDPLALRIAKDAIAKGDDKSLHPIERIFLFMPFEHAEDLSHQRTAVQLYQQLAADEPARADLVGWAQKHLDIVARFGNRERRFGGVAQA